MTTTSKRKKRKLPLEQVRRQKQRRAFKAWLAKLPKELAADLEELFAMISTARNDAERDEIAATITELLYPDSLLVEMDSSFRMDIDDAATRKRVSKYRANVGKQITKFRIAKKMSQQQLGDAVGISQSHVCRLETGTHVPTFVTIERIAKALGVCPSQIDPGFESTVGNEES